MIVKDMEIMKGELASAKSELEKVMAVASESKTQMQIVVDAKASIEKELADIKAANEAKAIEAKDAMDKLIAEKSAVEAELVQVKGQLALVPVEQSNGREPVAEGGEAGAEIDWEAKLNALKGAELMAFYRANKEAIESYKRSRK